MNKPSYPILSIAYIIILAFTVNYVSAETINLEAETGQLTGNTVLNDGSGFSGVGYVGNFEAPNSALVLHATADAGIYEVHIRYRASSQKGFDLVVNGGKSSGMFPASGASFATYDAGKVELKQGDNTIAIERGWGYYQIDCLDLSLAPPAPTLKPIKAALADPKAAPKARQLMRFLLEHYGKKTFSGQQNIEDADYIQKTAGVSPAILSGDLIEYSPSRIAHGSKPDGFTEKLIQEAKSGHILSVMWHWNAPTDLLDKKYQNAQGKEIDASWYRGFYTEATTFDVAKALSDPKSEDYKLLLRDIDAIAAQLQKIQAADIPVLWRPLHEAEGGWFWWGAKGPDAFKKLWRLLYTRLTDVHHIHNLIWVYTSNGNMDWYPGDDVVDIIGMDAYPSDITDPLSGTWQDLLHKFDGRKILALTEFGGVPDVDRMARFGVHWSYFASWGGNLGPRKVSAEELTRLYHEKDVLNEDICKTLAAPNTR
jgi:mannan endo-1,4-beta-mannosidase